MTSMKKTLSKANIKKKLLCMSVFSVVLFHFIFTFMLKLCVGISMRMYYYWKIYKTYRVGFCYIVDKKIYRLNKINWLFSEFQAGNIITCVPNKVLYTRYFIEHQKVNLFLSA